MTFATYQVLKTSEVPADLDSTIYSVIPISRTDGKKGKSGLCMIVHALSANSLQAVFSSAEGQAWFTDAVTTIRGRLASALNLAGHVVGNESVAISAILAAMKAETESQRMTKESIGNWFDSDLAPLVSARISSRMTGIAQDKLDKLVLGYRNAFVSLAQREVSMPDTLREQLEKAIALLPDDYSNVIAEKVAEKLATVTEATVTLTAL